MNLNKKDDKNYLMEKFRQIMLFLKDKGVSISFSEAY